MQTNVLLACRVLVVILAACGGGDHPGQGDFDPTGTWSTTLTWGSGTCISSGSEVTTLEIAAGAAGYDVRAGSGGSGSNVGGTVRLGCCVTLQSAFTCKGESCAWSGM